MAKKTPWAYLPNARHIDAVLEDVKARPEEWQRPQLRANTAHLRAAYNLALDRCAASHSVIVVWRAASTVARGATKATSSRGPATDVLLPLFAWDDSAALLTCTPDVLRAMIDLAEPPVCHQAALLLPYAIVRFGG